MMITLNKQTFCCQDKDIAVPGAGEETWEPLMGADSMTTHPLTCIRVNAMLLEVYILDKYSNHMYFTRYEIEHLTALLHSRTTMSDVGEGDQANISNDSHVKERENFHVVISTPVVNSRAFEEDVASPAELAKAYMGTSTRPGKVSPSTLRHGSQAPRQDSVLLNNTTILPRTHVTSLTPRFTCSLKGVENGMTTPRSHGRSAIYSMAYSPYYRWPLTLNKKPTSSLISSRLAWELEGSNGNKMAGKCRSSILDDHGSGGLMRRIRQKANLYSQGGRSASVIQAMHLFLPSPLKMASGGGALAGAGVGTDDSMMVDKLLEEINDMKIKVDKVEKEMEAIVVDGHGTEIGHIIVTTIGDRNGQLKQVEYFLYVDETEDEEEYVEETIQDAIMIAAAKTSCSWIYSQGMKVYAFIIMLAVCTLGFSLGCIFTLTAITKWECSSYGRALALNARGTGRVQFKNGMKKIIKGSSVDPLKENVIKSVPSFKWESKGRWGGDGWCGKSNVKYNLIRTIVDIEKFSP
nr:hypothetical protein [Tanacetum cinerariifolium]